MKDEGFVSRWSRRKSQAKVETPPAEEAVAPAAPPQPQPPAIGEKSEPAELPPVESLTHESDFTPFMQAGVDPDVKREALKKLMRDPRHNIMDGLDVYIDDYSKPDPLPEGWLEKIAAVKRLGIFQEPTEGDTEPVAAAPPSLQKAMEEQALAPPTENFPSHTAGAEELPFVVPESAPKPE